MSGDNSLQGPDVHIHGARLNLKKALSALLGAALAIFIVAAAHSLRSAEVREVKSKFKSLPVRQSVNMTKVANVESAPQHAYRIKSSIKSYVAAIPHATDAPGAVSVEKERVKSFERCNLTLVSWFDILPKRLQIKFETWFPGCVVRHFNKAERLAALQRWGETRALDAIALVSQPIVEANLFRLAAAYRIGGYFMSIKSGFKAGKDARCLYRHNTTSWLGLNTEGKVTNWYRYSKVGDSGMKDLANAIFSDVLAQSDPPGVNFDLKVSHLVGQYALQRHHDPSRVRTVDAESDCLVYDSQLVEDGWEENARGLYKNNVSKPTPAKPEILKSPDQHSTAEGLPQGQTVFTITVLTMNRVKSLARLLRSIEHAEYGSDRVRIIIKVDSSTDNHGAVAVAKSFNFTHGSKTVIVARENQGLRQSWLTAWTPDNNSSFGIILEDDVELSPKWYTWLKGAWSAYGNRTDIMGISLNRQTRRMRNTGGRSPFENEIVNNHMPFLYKFIGTWGYSPHPARWQEFIQWCKDNAEKPPSFFHVPNILASEWWKEFIRSGRTGSMWTQYVHYFVETARPELYHLYINLPGKVTLSAHHREAGEHYKGGEGRDFPLALHFPFEFPVRLRAYGWDARCAASC